MKVHVLLTKEEINEERLREKGKVAVVLDVLLATTTIISALNEGAKEVIPVMDANEAFKLSQSLKKGDFILAGERDARPIEHFHYPSPTLLSPLVEGKSLILSTTNGTIALKKAEAAEHVYISSLLNNERTARQLLKCHRESTIVIICSGNAGEVSLEDVYGAGHLIQSLLTMSEQNFSMSDAAKMAYYLFLGNRHNASELLSSSHVGQLFENHGLLQDLTLAATANTAPVLAVMKNGAAILEAGQASPSEIKKVRDR
ncbi:2-phosphosulfolactate phosphatase [Fictibacillus fluitans]|uniref:Probable 2-phosphosulfolactate phosphatase n=1 Tax=Fictibacillus fluitans TaxID=3058422 RepID=A0ABT8HQQ2_9BACL|nr:2-phosphosulfolactate phosphatase [Fictibacillus sp. NE201]MDN4523083.1 2-phosphosulfolactate phosphatase [Fictibacillus sp. NE201]